MQANLTSKDYKNQVTLAAIIIIAVGVFVRVIGFGEIPIGFNQDEAFAAYESYSLLNYGVDSAGNPYPTFFVSWGSGMNVLESYLAIPFMWIFGYSEGVFRLPQLIFAILSMPAFFIVLKRFFGSKTALFGLGLLAISPWHIMLSRWGLESNLAPAFMLFGLLFLLKGLEKNGYLLLSALFYGLSLYTYSTTWLAVPLIIIIYGIYIIKSNIKIKPIYFISALAILFLLALPHILFLFVNSGVIPEIKTQFFTIPKMVAMRSDDISFLNIFKGESLINLFKILFFQRDNTLWNSSGYGMFYYASLPFFAVGIVKLFGMLASNLKAKKFSGAYFVLGGFFVFILVSLSLSNLNVNKANGMHLFTLTIIAVGIYTAVGWVNCKKIAVLIVTLTFAIHFIFFFGFYFKDGGTEVSKGFAGGIGESIEYVNDENFKKVAIDRNIYHSFVLYYDKTSPEVYQDTVKYENYPSEFLRVKSFGKYTFGIEYNKLGDYDAYIFPLDHLYFFSEKEFDIKSFKGLGVAVKK